MGILSKISDWLSPNNTAEPDIRYAHPSHDPNYRKAQRDNNRQQKKTVTSRQDLFRYFQDYRQLVRLSLECIEEAGPEGLSTYEVNACVISHVLDNSEYADAALSTKKINDLLHQTRINLCNSGKIGFNKKQKVWYPKKTGTRNLTEKEERFLRAKGLDADQWVNIASELEAIKWLYQKFTADEFEQFCCSLLEHLDGKNVVVTRKRQSGADGGIDGLGEYKKEDDGTVVKIAFEAKKHNPDTQVGSDICQKLAGAMMENGIDHGVIITTAIFSERAQQSTIKMKANNNYRIELIDQKKMAEIMIYKGKSPHGFGLYKSEKGFVYINESILLSAARKT